MAMYHRGLRMVCQGKQITDYVAGICRHIDITRTCTRTVSCQVCISPSFRSRALKFSCREG
jgi:hypothetical protein